jgi:hypothetical protein
VIKKASSKMNSRKKHTKIWYVPGILSLAIMPILFTMQINNYIDGRKEYAIPISYNPDGNGFNLRYGIPKMPGTRDYLIFEFRQEQQKDSVNLKLIENTLREVEQSKDTTLGVKMLFNNALKYRSVVDAINACLKSQINTFLMQSDTLISYHRVFTSNDDTLSKVPSPDLSKLHCGLFDCVRINTPETKQSFFDWMLDNRRIIIIVALYFIWYVIIGLLNINKLIKTWEM